MNLKESFRYQNFLSQMMNGLSMYFGFNTNVTKTEQEHLRKKANPEAEDEKLDATPVRSYGDYPVDKLVQFYEALAEERIALCAAIENAKRSYIPSFFDAEMEANRIRQSVANTLRRMAAIKNTESVITGRDYKFNANGEQVPYVYDIKSVTTIDFDRNAVRSTAKRYTDKANEVSEALDHALLDIQVVIDPAFDMTQNLEEAIESFMTK